METTELLWGAAVTVVVCASFLVSASVGLGGSLLLVPALSLALGTKEGVALAALLLGCNNVLKVFAYRRSIPWRASAAVVALVAVGAFVGAALMASASESFVAMAVLVMLVLTLVTERTGWEPAKVAFAPGYAFVSGATSGFSGTSGPLKGAAIRHLGLDRRHFVGAASVASLAGDLTKTAVFVDAQLLGRDALMIAAAAVPLMVLGTWMGVTVNRRAGERGFALLFWSVMAGYGARLLTAVV